MFGLLVFTTYSVSLGLILLYLTRPYKNNLWLTVKTQNPAHVYSVGPFASLTEATKKLPNYQETLEANQATIVDIQFHQQFAPQKLIVCAK